MQSQRIEVLVDVRQFPGSRRHPQFGREALRQTLAQAGIEYIHLPELGGRRRARRDSPNWGWRNEAFRGYADYMMTYEFQRAAECLRQVAREKRTVMMCAEALWWRCHRSLISDYLKAKSARVFHIMNKEKIEEHPFTAPAKLVGGELSYGLDVQSEELPLKTGTRPGKARNT